MDRNLLCHCNCNVPDHQNLSELFLLMLSQPGYSYSPDLHTAYCYLSTVLYVELQEWHELIHLFPCDTTVPSLRQFRILPREVSVAK